MDRTIQNEQIYFEMINSTLVRRYLNPLSKNDKEMLQIMKKHLNDTKKFKVINGIGYWILNKEQKPISIEIAFFAKFLGKYINIEKQRMILSSYPEMYVQKIEDTFTILKNQVLFKE